MLKGFAPKLTNNLNFFLLVEFIHPDNLLGCGLLYSLAQLQLFQKFVDGQKSLRSTARTKNNLKKNQI